MKPRAKWLIAAVLLLSHLCFGEESKPDRVISVTRLERREGSTAKPYQVKAKGWIGKTSESQPTLYYELACGASAADLKVTKVYEAMELTAEGTKTLVIFRVTETQSTSNDVSCNVESVKDDSKH
jgi:hypothetical protein